MPAERRHPNIVNHDELEPSEMKQGKHHVKTRRFGQPTGTTQLGCAYTEVPPGAISYPFHYHCANEEAVYVISGTGTARIGDARVTVGPGDWIAYPVGPTTAHQLINDGDVPLVYLAMSTMLKCEIVGYPDSNKVAANAGVTWDKPWIRHIARNEGSLGYWDGEPDAK